MKEMSPNKIKILLVLGAIACIMVPVVLAADWSISYNSGDEPFRVESSIKDTGTNLRELIDIIEITNNGAEDWNGNNSASGDARVYITCANLTLSGSGTGDKIWPVYVWINFTDAPDASERGWLNITDVFQHSDPGNKTCIIYHTGINMMGEWVYTENGHTAGNSPLDEGSDYWIIKSGDMITLKLFYYVDSNNLDGGTYWNEDNAAVTLEINVVA